MSFKIDIITPNGLYKSVNASSLTIKTSSGYRTILEGHTALIAALDYGKATIKIDGKEKYFAIHGGAMNIKNDGVVLLLNSIEEKDEIDIERANKALERAKERIENKNDPNLDIKRAELALKRALARIDTFNS